MSALAWGSLSALCKLGMMPARFDDGFPSDVRIRFMIQCPLIWGLSNLPLAQLDLEQ